MMSRDHGDSDIFLLLCAEVCYMAVGEYNMSRYNKRSVVNIHQNIKVNDDQTIFFKHALSRYKRLHSKFH